MELIHNTLPTGARVTAWIHSDSPEMTEAICYNRPAVVVCPGGGYSMVSGREKDPAASDFFHMGANVFLLEYSVKEAAGGKRPLEELARTVLQVRTNAVQYRIDPNKLTVIGFSAGAHLAASLGVHWDDPEIAARCGVTDSRLLRPDAMILSYPVITAGEFAHRGSIVNVSQDCDEPLEYWSLETQVKETTPPAFLWHTMEDSCVPVENSLLMAAALHRHGVACECHLFPHGPHGMSMCTAEVRCYEPSVRKWMDLCRTWLEGLFGRLPGAM